MQVTEKIVFPRTRFTQLLHFHDFADISQRSFVVSWCSFSMSIFADTSHMQTNFGCKPRYVKSNRRLMNPSIKKQSCRNEAEKQLVFARRTETENMTVGEKKNKLKRRPIVVSTYTSVWPFLGRASFSRARGHSGWGVRQDASPPRSGRRRSFWGRARSRTWWLRLAMNSRRPRPGSWRRQIRAI